MRNNQGFSLTEVLVSLLLVTSTSLALLKQQWQVSQLFNQLNTRINARSQLENEAERLQVNYNLVTIMGRQRGKLNKQQGIGLPEVLISLVLASIITLVLMNHYLGVKQQYHYFQTEIEHRIDLQLVSDLMRNSIRQAGFTPCGGISHLITLDQRNERQNLVAIALAPDARSWFRTSRMSEHFNTVLNIIDSTHLSTTYHKALEPDQSVLIADCFHAEVQKVTEEKRIPTGQIITLATPLSFAYVAPIYIGEWVEETYSIRQSEEVNGSLFYQLQHAEALTSAVHSMSVQLNPTTLNSVLHIILRLDHDKKMVMDTRIRTP